MHIKRLNPERLLRLTCAVFGLLLLALVQSCAEDGPSPFEVAVDLNEEGWMEYGRENYAVAKIHFVDAHSLDWTMLEARLGRAWCEAHLGDYAKAVRSFEGLKNRPTLGDGYAGLAAASLEIPDYEEAIAAAESTLAHSPEYEFHRRPSYNYLDIRLIMAQAHFALAEYADAQAQVDILDPDNGLDPAVSGSWEVEGVTYATYEAALAMRIEWLWAAIGGGGL